jgi:hypothetical protein
MSFMKTTLLGIICFYLIQTLCCGSAEKGIPAKLVTKIIGEGENGHRYEMTRAPFTQTIAVNEHTSTNRGVLLELWKEPVGTKSEANGPELIWNMFVVESLDPREKWTGDIAVHSIEGDLFAVISSGTSFAVYKFKTNQVASRVSEKISSDTEKVNLSPPGSFVTRPDPAMLITMPQIDKISLEIEGDVLSVNVTSPERRERRYRYSLAAKRWL